MGERLVERSEIWRGEFGVIFAPEMTRVFLVILGMTGRQEASRGLEMLSTVEGFSIGGWRWFEEIWAKDGRWDLGTKMR